LDRAHLPEPGARLRHVVLAGLVEERARLVGVRLHAEPVAVGAPELAASPGLAALARLGQDLHPAPRLRLAPAPSHQHPSEPRAPGVDLLIAERAEGPGRGRLVLLDALAVELERRQIGAGALVAAVTRLLVEARRLREVDLAPAPELRLVTEVRARRHEPLVAREGVVHAGLD